MNSQQSRILFIAGGAVIIILLIIGFVLSLTSPLKPVRGFIGAVEGQKKDEALGFVKESIDQAAKDDITFFVDDWMTAGKPTVEIEKTDAYDVSPVEGDAAPTFNPTPKYWSHNARVFLTVGFEEFDDPVMFTLERKSGGNGMFKNIFRGWEIVAIEYQPIGEEDGEEIELDAEPEAVLEGEETNAGEADTDAVEDTTEEITVDGDQEDPGTIEQ
jgi:hypothetical protein